MKRTKWTSSQQSLVPACGIFHLDMALMFPEAIVSQCQMQSMLAFSSLFEATDDPQFVSVFSGFGWTQL